MDFITRLKTEYGIALNDQQQAAARATGGAVLVLAVPGSGKTTVLIARLANLIQAHGVPPHKILTITFSRRSAADMSARYARHFPDAPAPRFSTIHGFCSGVVDHISVQYRRPRPSLVEDPSEVVRELYCRLEGVRFVEREKLEELVNAIGLCKNRLADEEQVARTRIDGCDFPRLYRAYREEMSATRRMDYDDLLLFTYDMFRKNPGFLAQYHALYSHICVDEAQDTSLVQHKIVGLLAQKSGNLFMVGDEDQSIYGFRGAFPDALLGFAGAHPGALVLKMEKNYRSTPQIVAAANRLIRQNRARIEKSMVSGREGGAEVAVHEARSPSAQYDTLVGLLRKGAGTAAVLYRNNESAIPLCDALDRAGIPFSLKDTRDAFFQAAHVRDLVAFLRLSLKPSDLKSFSRIYGKTCAYFSRAALEFVQGHHKRGESVWKTLRRCPSVEGWQMDAIQGRMERLGRQTAVNALNLLEEVAHRSYFESETAARRLTLLKSLAVREETVEGLLDRLDRLQELIKKAPASLEGGVTLSTIHSAKGLEYERVFLVDLIEGQFPSKSCVEKLAQGERAAYEEEARLCYVAATRAKDELHLIVPADGNRACRPSRFARLLTAGPPPEKPAPKAVPRPKPPEKRIEGYRPVTDEKELRPGMEVLHDVFGNGRALRIENGFLTWFDGVVTKRLSLTTCIENRNLFCKL